MNKEKIKEFTPLAVGLGLVIGIIMTAANVYLGLYAGMTVSASIPAAVLAMGFFKIIRNKEPLLQSNIVQTMASAGESLAAGIIFTIPALVIVGAWQDFQFWPTTLIAISGGLLGVIFMIPLRRALIIEEKELTYPEGVACAAVLEEGVKGDGKGFITILKGLGLGALFKALTSGLKLIHGEVATATFAFKRIWFAGLDVSPALLAVGYIVKLEVAILVLIGGTIGWLVGIPAFGIPESLMESTALDGAWTLWSKQIRYLGVGAMLTGGIWSIISVRKGITKGVDELKKSYKAGPSVSIERSEQNMGLLPMFIIFILNICIMFGIYHYMTNSFGHALLTTIVMLLAAFLFVAVSSYIVGLVGSSNNPVSGMTISALLGSSALFLVLGYTGENAIMATLGVAAVVCCAACTAGDCSQDLKTGALLKASPRLQQWAEMIGVVIPAFVIAPVLTLLHGAYGIGTGLKAPQATLFASITNALFKGGDLPIKMVIIGIILGIVVIILDKVLIAKKVKFRLYLMPLAVGIYLPVTLAVPIFVGGLIRHLIDRKRGEVNEGSDNGILLSSGLIAGEAIMGVIIAIFIWNKSLPTLGIDLGQFVSLLAFTAIAGYLWYSARKKV